MADAIRRYARPMLVGAVAAVVMSGCAGRMAPDFKAVASARADTASTAARTFAVVSADVRGDAKLEQRTREVVVHALEAQGLRVDDASRADLHVSIAYAVGESRQVPDIAYEPVYYRYATPGYTTQRQVGTTKEGRPIIVPVTVAGDMREQYVGERAFCTTSTISDKVLRIEARANPARPEVRGWETAVALTDDGTDDARYAGMLAAAAATFADETADAEPVRIKRGGREVVRDDIETDSLTAIIALNRCNARYVRYASMPFVSPSTFNNAPLSPMYSRPGYLFQRDRYYIPITPSVFDVMQLRAFWY